MRKKISFWLLSFILLLPTFYIAKSSEDDSLARWSVRMAETAIRKDFYASVSYYVDATAIKGFRNLWQATGNEGYYQYINNLVNATLPYYESIAGETFHDIDPVTGGSPVLFMYSQTGETKYRSAADSILKFLKAFPRTSDGGFYHKDVPRMQVDDLFMASPFLAEYGAVFNKPEEYADAVKQAVLMEKHTRDSITGLYRHVWYEKEMTGTPAGCSPFAWGRGVGWVAMALVDILDFLPGDYSGRDSVIAVFQRLAEAISNVQDDSTGVWWQILDQGGRKGNFLESSASCMFVYALAKGIRLGYIDESYLPVVEKGYRGILNKFISENGDGTISITHVCGGQSPGYDYYTYVRTPGIYGHSVGPFILASVEIELRGLSPSGLQAVVVSDKQVSLCWNDNSDDEEGFIIERASEGDFIEVALVAPNTESYQDTTLTALTHYIYRIRTYKGDTVSFHSNYASIITLAENGAPAYASEPAPADEATSVSITPVLGWLPGAGSTSHDVFFGTTNPPPFLKSQTDSTFTPDTLENNTTYYWQVNEVNSSGTTQGDLWSFITIEARGMVAHWKMDENTGSVLLDDSGNGNDGTLVNMNNEAWVPGITGSALEFDGIDDYIRVPHSPSIDFGHENFSVSLWLKQSVSDKSMTYIIKGTHSDPGSGKRYEIKFLSEGDTNDIAINSSPDSVQYLSHLFRFDLDDNIVDPQDMIMMPDTNIIAGEWIHLFAYRKDMSLYIMANNKLIGIAGNETGDISQHEDLYIAVSPDEGNSYFKGSLDDIRIYNYALSLNEISSIYNEGVTKIKEYHLSRNSGPDLWNYPNPFSRRTTINYVMTKTEKVKITVHDILGREINVLVDEIAEEGKHSVEFDALNLSDGTYIYKLQSASGTRTGKMLFHK